MDSSYSCCSEMDSSCGCCSETDSFCGCCSETDSSCEVDGFGSAVFTSEVSFLLDAFLPGSYFLPLIVRWSFFSATAKSLVTCNCVHLELKSFFLIGGVFEVNFGEFWMERSWQY